MTETRSAIQLFTLRHIDEPLPEILERVAAAGFDGVEFGNRIADADIDAVVDALESTGLEPVAAHVDLSDIESQFDELRRRYERVGCTDLTVGHVDPLALLTDRRVRSLAARLESAGRRLSNHGFSLSYHTQIHDFHSPLENLFVERLIDLPFVPIPGQYGISKISRALLQRPAVLGFDDTVLTRLVEYTDPSHLSFELDIGWAVASGFSPEEVFGLLSGRVPHVHVHDVAESDAGEFGSVRPGTGAVDFDDWLHDVARHGVGWHIYEHDNPNDPIATIQHAAEAVLPLANRKNVQ